MIRTQRPFFLSRPGTLFLITEVAIALIVLTLPFSPLAKTLGFVPLPPGLMAIILAITLLYGIAMEVVKRLFYRYLAH